MSAVARHDARSLFERAWSHAMRDGAIDPARREALLVEGTRGIRRIASVLGSEFLRDDLERAMRSMLGLVNLHLETVSRGDVAAAARSIADNGLLFHTKGASQAIKRVIATEQGEEFESLDDASRRAIEEQVVTHWAHLPFAEFAERERGARERRQRRAAARAIGAALDGEPPDPYNEPEQVIMTALLILAYSPDGEWINDLKGFEGLLAAVREAPAKFSSLPAGVPAGHAAVIEGVWRERRARVIKLIADRDTPLHRLVAGDPLTNPLFDWLVVPDSALDDLDALGENSTSHWEALTGGNGDEPNLLLVMLNGVLGLDLKAPLGAKAAETFVKTTCATRPDDRALAAWLDANAPHQYHDGLRSLWEDFWYERETEMGDAATGVAWRKFAAAWLPVKAPKPRGTTAPPAST